MNIVNIGVLGGEGRSGNNKRTKENQQLVNTAIKCSKLTDNNRLAFNKDFQNNAREIMKSNTPFSSFVQN